MIDYDRRKENMKKLGKKANKSLRSVQAFSTCNVFCIFEGQPRCDNDCNMHPDSGGYARVSARDFFVNQRRNVNSNFFG